jgi:hypothetical protein
MWTAENRARYDRGHLRYPSDLTDAIQHNLPGQTLRYVLLPMSPGWTSECVVADAFPVEPVSTCKFPANREKYREIRRIEPPYPIQSLTFRRVIGRFCGNSLRKEQGISDDVAGK